MWSEVGLKNGLKIGAKIAYNDTTKQIYYKSHVLGQGNMRATWLIVSTCNCHIWWGSTSFIPHCSRMSVFQCPRYGGNTHQTSLGWGMLFFYNFCLLFIHVILNVFIVYIYIIQSIEGVEGGMEGGVVGDMLWKGNCDMWEDCSYDCSPYKHLMRSRHQRGTRGGLATWAEARFTWLQHPRWPMINEEIGIHPPSIPEATYQPLANPYWLAFNPPGIHKSPGGMCGWKTQPVEQFVVS